MRRTFRTPEMVIPGRGLLPVSPESITTGRDDTESVEVMDSGLAAKAAPRNDTAHDWKFKNAD